MNINELAKEIHENAVAHGWYDKAPSLPEQIANFHSELSEALEEYRNGKPPIYGTCVFARKDCEHEDECDVVKWGIGSNAYCKPQGIAFELSDCVIRILDTLHFMGVDVEGVIMAKHEYNKHREYRHGGKVI